MDEAIAQKDPLAVEFGRRGGKSRLVKMTAEARSRVARLAARARWAKKAGDPPPVPPDPNGPHRDVQSAEAGIMLSRERKPASPASVTNQPRGRAVAA